MPPRNHPPEPAGDIRRVIHPGIDPALVEFASGVTCSFFTSASAFAFTA